MIAWFLNEYRCKRCLTEWSDQWSSMCDDRCPNCERVSSPHFSTDQSRSLAPRDYVYAARRTDGAKQLGIVGTRRVALMRGGASVNAAIWVTDEEARASAQDRIEGR